VRMIGAVRQSLRSSRCRGYQRIGSQLLNGSQKASSQNGGTLLLLRAAAVRENAPSCSARAALSSSCFSTSAAGALKESPAPTVKNFVGGKAVESQASEHIDVINPATQEVVGRVPLTTRDELHHAVAVAKHAYTTWKHTPVTARQRVMLKLQELIRRDMDKLAMSVTTEQGKTLADARGDVFRGLEVPTLPYPSFISNFKLAMSWSRILKTCCVQSSIAYGKRCHCKNVASLKKFSYIKFVFNKVLNATICKISMMKTAFMRFFNTSLFEELLNATIYKDAKVCIQCNLVR
jgi:hypothetical protein